MTAHDTVLIAVDGGGTGCRAAVGTAARGVLAEAKGGPANVSTNFDDTVANIMTAVAQALEQAGLNDADLGRATAHIGLAGADSNDLRQRTRTALPFGSSTISGDRKTTVAGVLGAQDGYVIALGTGTIIARQHGGDMRTVGGWGFQLSDQASGAWLGRALLTRILLVEDGLEVHTALSERISLQLGGLLGIVTFSRAARPGDYARFAPEIFAAAQQGDTIGLDLLQDGTAFLERGLSVLGFTLGDVLSLSGGVGPHYAPYLSAEFTRELRPPQGNALEGAFSLARQAAVGRSDF